MKRHTSKTSAEDCCDHIAELGPDSTKPSKEKAKKGQNNREKKAKKPKITFTKVKQFNKPKGPWATAMKTLKHPLSSHAPDQDVVVIRQYGYASPSSKHFRPAESESSTMNLTCFLVRPWINSSMSMPGQTSVTADEDEAAPPLPVDSSGDESRPSVRVCWSEHTQLRDVSADMRSEVATTEMERPSNPTPLYQEPE